MHQKRIQIMATHAAATPDPRALKILFDAYWKSTGWRDRREVRSDDFFYAKQAGVMFDDVPRSHDEIIKRARTAVQDVDRQSVADAFLVSLTCRRLDLRSALGSFAVLRNFPDHRLS